MANPNFSALIQEGAIEALDYFIKTATVKFRLCAGTGISATSSLAAVAAAEVAGNGYPDGGLIRRYEQTRWNATENRAEAEFEDFILTPTGGNIVFRQVVVTIKNPGIIEKPLCYATWASDETALNALPYNFKQSKILFGQQGASVAPQP